MTKPVVVITGGSDGLGKEVARLLVGDCQVVIVSSDEGKLQNTSREIGADYIVCNVSNPETVETIVKTIIEKHGRIDTLVNCAGIWTEGKLEDSSPATIQKVFAVNTFGTIFFTRAVLPFMKSARAGKIINVISQGGLLAKPERTIYYSSKWAITGFTKCLEEELYGSGVTVAGIYPAKMKTGLFAKAGYGKELNEAIKPEEVARTIADIIISSADSYVSSVEIKYRS